MSACPTYKQGMKAIGFSLEDEDASEIDHEDFMRGEMQNSARGVSFATLKVILILIVRHFGML